VVVARVETETAPGRVFPGGAAVLVPDPRHRLPGRGAWLHPEPECLELAERRRAFARALRVQGPVDSRRIGEYLQQLRRQ
jgi:uncharacterized protein